MVRICISENSLMVVVPTGRKAKDKKPQPLFANDDISSRIFEVAKNGKVKEFKLLLSGDPNFVHVCDNQMRTLAHIAAFNNHANILKLIVDCNGSMDALDEQGCSPLHLAVESEALDSICYLLNSNVDTRILNKEFQSPIHMAAQHGKVQSLKVMSKYVDILDANQPGEHGRTPLHLACIENQYECVKILIEELKASPLKACDHSLLPVHQSAKLGSFEALENLLHSGGKSGFPINEMINSPDSEGNQALHYAVQSGDLKIVELCIECGAKISATQKDLFNAVHLACAQGSTQIVKLMLSLQPEEKDVSLKSCDSERMTPIHYAAKFDHAELVEFLVEQVKKFSEAWLEKKVWKKAHLNSLDKNKCTPLHLAASKNAWRTIKTLVRLGANVKIQDINKYTVLHTIIKYNSDLNNILDKEIAASFIPILETEDKKGNTPVHIATRNDQVKIFSSLLELGSSIVSKNVDGDTVLHTACRFGRSKIIQLLMEHPHLSTVLNESNNNGWTPVHLAVQKGHHRVLELLVKKGAFLRKDFKGRTPLHLAAENGHQKVVSLILNTHSHLLDLLDVEGNTALHSAAMYNKSKVVKLLLSLNCRLTYNKNGYSAMDLALENKFMEAAFEMATHPKRGNEIMELTEGAHECIMETLISKLPTVAKAVLDSGIRMTSSEKPDSPDYPVEYDFRRLKKPEGSNSKKREEDYLSILNTMVTHQREDLLSHELCLKYLEMKWNSYGNFFQYSDIIFYVIFLCLVTSLATNELERDGSFFQRWKWFEDPTYTNSSDNSTCTASKFIGVKLFESFQNAYDAFEAQNGGSLASWNTLYFIAYITASNLIVEIINFCRHGFEHFKNGDNWVWILMNISCCVAVFPIFLYRYIEYDERMLWDLYNPSLALAVFMGWFYLLMITQRFDAIGLYVSMFLEILKTLFRVLVIFSILIVAFALAFFVLLSNGNHIAFSTIPLSIVRTFSMMLGDLDFMSTFLYPHHCEEMEKGNRTYTRLYTTAMCTYPRRIPHSSTTFPIVCLYLVFMPIVMINLLIGLAVGDIESVRKNAKLKRLSMQVQSHTNMEKLIPNFILRRIDKSLVVEYPNAKKCNGILESLGKFFKHKEKHDDEDQVEIKLNDLMKADLESSTSTTIDQLSTEIENVKESIQLICARLQISSEVKAGEAEPVDVVQAIPGILKGLRNARRKKLEWNDSADSNT